MEELLKLFDNNGIKYSISDYDGYVSIVINKNNYKLEIFKDEKGYVSDLHNIPYTWGRMGSTTLDEILADLRFFLNINIFYLQLTLF